VRSIFHPFLLVGTLILPVASHASLPPDACLSELDNAFNQYTKGNTEAASDLLNQLKNSCSHLPQVHHNLGVLAADKQQWEAASEHFQQAIANDSRTVMTHAQLQLIHQYKASVAYRKAMGITGRVSLPTLSMQSSSDINTSQSASSKTALHTAPTIDYELFAWWNAAATESMAAWLEHYVAGYPPQENADARLVEWDNVGRDISFIEQEAVVVLSYRLGELQKRSLLFMRLDKSRWKIYKETLL